MSTYQRCRSDATSVCAGVIAWLLKLWPLVRSARDDGPEGSWRALASEYAMRYMPKQRASAARPAFPEESERLFGPFGPGGGGRLTTQTGRLQMKVNPKCAAAVAAILGTR